jgi:hypothetical protein
MWIVEFNHISKFYSSNLTESVLFILALMNFHRVDFCAWEWKNTGKRIWFDEGRFCANFGISSGYDLMNSTDRFLFWNLIRYPKHK